MIKHLLVFFQPFSCKLGGFYTPFTPWAGLFSNTLSWIFSNTLDYFYNLSPWAFFCTLGYFYNHFLSPWGAFTAIFFTPKVDFFPLWGIFTSIFFTPRLIFSPGGVFHPSPGCFLPHPSSPSPSSSSHRPKLVTPWSMTVPRGGDTKSSPVRQ